MSTWLTAWSMRWPASGLSGEPEDQRNMNGAVVNEVAVKRFAMVAQPLAVIRGDHHHAPLQNAPVLELADEATDQRIGVGHLGLVGPARVLGAKGLRRGVGIVRVVEVKPEAKRTLLGFISLSLFQPPEGRRDGLASWPLHRAQIRIFERTEVEIVEVVVESTADAPARVEHEGADEAGGLPPRLAEHLGQGPVAVAEVVADVLAHPVEGRVGAGHDRAVSGEGEGHGCRSVGEQHAFGRQPIEVRRPDV